MKPPDRLELICSITLQIKQTNKIGGEKMKTVAAISEQERTVKDYPREIDELIIKEVKLPYNEEYTCSKGCTKVAYCSCDCDFVSCPIFLG